MAKGLGSWENAPLVLACVDVEFGRRASFSSEVEKLGVLQQSSKYPRFERGQATGMAFRTSPQGEVSLQQSATTLVQFHNASNSVAFRVAEDRLTFFDADYSGNFVGLLQRFLEVFDIWADAASGLSVTRVSYRTFDVVRFDDPGQVVTSLRKEWCGGEPVANSSGLAIRDTFLDDGSRHFRVRNGIAEKDRPILLATDLPMAPVTLPHIAGPFAEKQVVAVIDIERKLTVSQPSREEIKDVLQGLHHDIDEMFESVFTSDAMRFFKGVEGAQEC
jgi:uncharacterized protein (TIGR04255 family)